METGVRGDITAKVRGFIAAHGLIRRGDRVLLALSAGKDSMCLLHLMHELRHEFECGLGIFHCNHCLRGGEADEDEEMIRRLARQLHLPCDIARCEVRALRGPGRSLEEAARELRYRLLREAAKAGGYDRIATAHTESDHVETILMRIFTGTGIHGLAGIPIERDGIIRPLRCLTSEDVRDFLSARGIAWREDHSNHDLSFTRNFVRHEIIPRLLTRFPMLYGSIGSLSEIAGDELSLLDELIERCSPVPCHEENGCLLFDAGALSADPRLFAHEICRAIRLRFGFYPNRTMVRQSFSRLSSHRSNIELYRDEHLLIDRVRSADGLWIRIAKRDQYPRPLGEWEYPLAISESPTTFFIKEIGRSVETRLVDYEYFLANVKKTTAVFITLENTTGMIYIRNRRRGDAIRTEGGTKKVKDIFIQLKLDPLAKSMVPILADDERVLSVMPGFISRGTNRVSRDFMVDKKSKKILGVSVSGGSDTQSEHYHNE